METSFAIKASLRRREKDNAIARNVVDIIVRNGK
jgi:hypothetical protein